MKNIRCPHCGTITKVDCIVPGSDVFCAQCRTRLVRSPLGSLSVLNPTCPYCARKIDSDEISLFCSSCQTEYHEDCWKEGGGCQVYGCTSADSIKNTDDSLHLCSRCRLPIRPDQVEILCPHCYHPYHQECWSTGGCVDPQCQFVPSTEGSISSSENKTSNNSLDSVIPPSPPVPQVFKPSFWTSERAEKLKTLGKGLAVGISTWLALFLLWNLLQILGFCITFVGVLLSNIFWNRLGFFFCLILCVLGLFLYPVVKKTE